MRPSRQDLGCICTLLGLRNSALSRVFSPTRVPSEKNIPTLKYIEPGWDECEGDICGRISPLCSRNSIYYWGHKENDNSKTSSLDFQKAIFSLGLLVLTHH